MNSAFAPRFKRLLVRVHAVVLTAMVTLALWGHAAAVFAQGRSKAPAEAPPAEKSYVLPYVIVVLCVALGLLVVCRSGNRSKEPKLDNLE